MNSLKAKDFELGVQNEISFVFTLPIPRLVLAILANEFYIKNRRKRVNLYKTLSCGERALTRILAHEKKNSQRLLLPLAVAQCSLLLSHFWVSVIIFFVKYLVNGHAKNVSEDRRPKRRFLIIVYLNVVFYRGICSVFQFIT